MIPKRGPPVPYPNMTRAPVSRASHFILRGKKKKVISVSGWRAQTIVVTKAMGSQPPKRPPTRAGMASEAKKPRMAKRRVPVKKWMRRLWVPYRFSNMLPKL